MALKATKPEAVEKRLKLLLFGSAGSGKTTAAIQFPRPYLIDTERGAENAGYTKLLKEAGGVYLHTYDVGEIIEEVKALATEEHEYKTLVIDPITLPYDQLLDEWAEKVGTDFGKHKGPADRAMKHLWRLLFKLDMNVILTSHAKPNWTRAKDQKGKDTVVQEGMTFDTYGKTDYMVDLVLEGKKVGRDRVCVVRKSRLDGFDEGDEFDMSYAAIADRYGREVLERDTVPIDFATPEQVEELQRMLTVRTDGDALASTWLKKADAESFDEMKQTDIAKCLDWLKKEAA